MQHRLSTQRRLVIGVMGPGESARTAEVAAAHELGCLIAREGWVTLSGGRCEGVMEAASRGARNHGGLVVGILPTPDHDTVSSAVDVAIFTDLGQGRNNLNVLSSDAVVACGMSAGTASEVALAIKAGKHVILLQTSTPAINFFRELGSERVYEAASAEAAISKIKELLST